MEVKNTERVMFGRLIKARRVKAGLTQGGLAKLMNVTRNTVVNWEADKSKPDHCLIPGLCGALGIRPHELFGMEPEGGLSEAEQSVVGGFRALSPAGRRVVDKLIGALLCEEADARAEAVKNSFGLFLVRPGMAAAGAGDYVPDSPPTFAFLRRNTVNERADGIVRVDGASMEPVYRSGDYVYYQNAVSAAPGEDVIADTDDGAVIKRVSADNTLYSVNPDIPYPGKSEQNTLVIRGRVLGTVYPSDRPGREEEAELFELFADEIREFERKNGAAE